MNILIIQGHPDPAGGHLCHVLADSYATGARAGGHEVRVQTVADKDISFMRSQAEFEDPALPEYAASAQRDVLWAQHIVIVFPLWLGGMPAILKAWMEQVFKADFAFEMGEGGFKRHLKGRSARLVVPMGAPVMAYRLIFGAFGTRLLRRSILGMAGIGPVRQTLIGAVDTLGADGVARLRADLEEIGQNAR